MKELWTGGGNGRRMKKQGNIAELKFITKAMQMDIAVSLTYGDNQKYDCITDRKGLNRIQVKSTTRHETSSNLDAYNSLVCHGSKEKKRYTTNDCDFIAVLVIPFEAWYLIPISEITGKTVKLYPHKSTDNKYEQWREAWHLL